MAFTVHKIVKPAKAWNVIVLGVLAKWENTLLPNVSHIFEPGFPQKWQDFFNNEASILGLAENWMFNVQTGLAEFLVSWPFGLAEWRSPPIIEFIAALVMLAVGLRLWVLRHRSLYPVAFYAFLVLLLAHIATYALISLAFLAGRYFIYALPISLFFYLTWLTREPRQGWRWAGIAFLAGTFLLSLHSGSIRYRNDLDPYSDFYVRTDAWSFPPSAYLTERDPQTGAEWAGGPYHLFIRPTLGFRYFISNRGAAGLDRYELVIRDGGQIIFQKPLSELDVLRYEPRIFSASGPLTSP